jgi:hypothetical protein
MFAERLICSWIGALCLAAGAFAQSYVVIIPSNRLGVFESLFPQSINDEGAITGYYLDTGVGPQHGFVRAAEGGTTTSFDPPHHSSSGAATFAYSINDAGAIAGYVGGRSPKDLFAIPRGTSLRSTRRAALIPRLLASMPEARSPAITMKRTW